MNAHRFLMMTVFEMEGQIHATLRLTDQHSDESKEELVLPLRIQAVKDADDMESWARDHLAAAIEVI